MHLRHTLLHLGIAACLLGPSPSLAEPLRVIVSFAGHPAPTRPLGYFLRPNGILPIAPPSPDPRREAVLEVLPDAGSPKLPVPSAIGAPLPVRQSLRILGQRILPRLSLVAPGGVIELSNEDQQSVTVELSPALPGQPSLRLAAGQTQKIPVPPSGDLSLLVREQPATLVRVLAPAHPAMHLVLGDQGTMAVATLDVPAGKYQVRLRVPGGSPWQEEVVVPPGGRELSLKASLGEER